MEVQHPEKKISNENMFIIDLINNNRSFTSGAVW